MSPPSTARAQPVASSGRVSLRNERQVGSASDRRAVNMKLPTATIKSHRVASADAPVIDGERIVAATSRRASSRLERHIGIASNLAADELRAHSKLRRRRRATQAASPDANRYRRREARLAAPSCRVSARNMRRVGHASKCRRRVVNIELPTATMTSHRVASADAPLIDGESTVRNQELSSPSRHERRTGIACSNEPSSLVTSRAAYRHCPRRRRVENTKQTTATTKSCTRSLFRRHHHRRQEHGLQRQAVDPNHATSSRLAMPTIAAAAYCTQSCQRRRRRSATTKIYMSSFCRRPRYDSESTTRNNEPLSLVTHRAAFRHCQQSPPTS